MGNAVFGIATSEFQAEAIVNELKVAQFSDSDISVLLADQASQPTGSDKMVGGTLGWLAGIRSIAIPGAGPFIATGPVLDALSGAAVGSSVRAITSALAGMGLSPAGAWRAEQRVHNGALLIAVHVETVDEAARAEAIFAQAGAQEITVSTDAPPVSGPMRETRWK